MNDNSHWVENAKKIKHYRLMNEIYCKKLGNNIRNMRKAKNLSQEKLAELLGKSRNYVGLVERGELYISTSSLYEFARILNVHPKTFFEF